MQEVARLRHGVTNMVFGKVRGSLQMYQAEHTREKWGMVK